MQVPEFWGGTIPPTPACIRCGAKQKAPYGRVIQTERPEMPNEAPSGLSEGGSVQNAERGMFELHIRSVDPQHAGDRLRRHTDKTWLGSDETMPTYIDKWTDGLWIGWKLRAQLVANQAELDGAIRQDASTTKTKGGAA